MSGFYVLKSLILGQRLDFIQTLKEYVLPLSYNHSPNRIQRIAKEGEKPTIEFTMKLGKPASPSLYEGVPLESTH